MDPPVIPVCIDRHEALIGPLYTPRHPSVCPECLDYWLDMNFYDRRASDEVPAAATLHPLAEAITRLAALPPTDVTLTHAQVIRLADGHVSRHAVYPAARLPATAPRERAERSVPLHRPLQSAGPASSAGMEQTAAPVRRLPGAPRPPGRRRCPSPTARAWIPAAPAVVRPRPHTARDARQGCIGEALERYSLIDRGDEPLGARDARVRCDARSIPTTSSCSATRNIAIARAWNDGRRTTSGACRSASTDSAPVDWLQAARALSRGGRDRLVAGRLLPDVVSEAGPASRSSRAPTRSAAPAA